MHLYLKERLDTLAKSWVEFTLKQILGDNKWAPPTILGQDYY